MTTGVLHCTRRVWRVSTPAGRNRRRRAAGLSRSGAPTYNSCALVTFRRTRLLPLSTIVAALTCVAHPLGAQILPERPVVFAGGRAVVSGDVSVTTSCSHAENDDSRCTGDTGFFNYSDYDHSTLRMARFGVTTSVRINNHISALADMRLENTTPRPYGAYV